LSVVISGINASVLFFLLIALNGFFCYVKVPIVAFCISGISILYVIGFSVDFTGLNIILSLILIVFTLGSLVINFKDFSK
jgi:hypothetical protein